MAVFTFKIGANQEVNLIDGVNYAVDGPIRVNDLVQREGGKNKRRSRLQLSDGDYEVRYISWTQKIWADTTDNLRTKYEALREQLAMRSNVIWWNTGGATEPDVRLVCFSVSPAPEITNQALALKRYKVQITMDLRPFAVHGTMLDLPKNGVKNPCMDGRAFANAWTADDSGTVPNGSTTPDATDAASDGAMCKMVLSGSGGGAGRYRGWKQTLDLSFTAGVSTIWAQADWESLAATNGAVYHVYLLFVGPGSTKDIINTTPGSTQSLARTTVSQLVPGGTTSIELRVRMEAPNASSAGTLWLDKLVASIGEIPKGQGGRRMAWGNKLGLGPGSIFVDNVPGNAPALTRLSMASSVAGNADRLFLAKRVQTRKHAATGAAKSFPLVSQYAENLVPPPYTFTTTADGACLNGSYIRVTSTLSGAGQIQFRGVFELDTRMADVYTMYVKFRESNGRSDNKIKWVATQGGHEKSGDWVTLSSTTSWQKLILNKIIPHPLRRRPTGSSKDVVFISFLLNTQERNANHDFDFGVLLPSVQQVYAMGGALTSEIGYGDIEQTQYSRLISDGITGYLPDSSSEPGASPGLFCDMGTSPYPAYPQPLNANVMPWAFDHNGEPVKLDPGANEVLGWIYDTVNQGTIHDLNTAISILPRWEFGAAD